MVVWLSWMVCQCGGLGSSGGWCLLFMALYGPEMYCCNGIDCYCTVVVLEWVFSWLVVQLTQVVMAKRCFPGWLGACVWWYFPLCWLLTVSYGWFRLFVLFLMTFNGLGSSVVYVWASWTWFRRGTDCILCVVGRTDCGHWGALVIHERMFIIWLGYGAVDWICI